MTGSDLLLLRHGASTWNHEQRWQGVADPPLSPAGEVQSQRAGEALARDGRPFDAVVASDLRRAARTAAVIATAIGWAGEVACWPGLREYDIGAWSGLTRPAIESRWPGQIARWRAGELAAPPGGELRTAFDRRVAETVGQLATAHPGGRVLAVTHSGVITALGRALGAALGPVPHLGGCQVRATPRRGGAVSVELIGSLDLLQAVHPERAERIPSDS